MLTALHILDTGYCLASEHHLIRGGAKRLVRCHALTVLLHHEREGWLLFDTGYHPRMFTATEQFPYTLYRRLTPLHIPAEKSVAAQLPHFGLRSDDIGIVILSHFHADHLSGLCDFPKAQIIAQETAWEAVRGRSGFAALHRAFLPDLLPPDFSERFAAIQEYDDANASALPGIGTAFDMFRDGSVLLVLLPGHARGQIGMLCRLHEQEYFFVADAAYCTRSIVENIPPHPITHLFADDAHTLHGTLAALHAFHRARPEVLLIPTHCPDAYARFIEKAKVRR